jgi:hypothetical protein
MKDYRKEEKIVQAYTSSENNEQIYEMTFNCAEVVELMQIAVKNLPLSGVSDIVHRAELKVLENVSDYIPCEIYSQAVISSQKKRDNVR